MREVNKYSTVHKINILPTYIMEFDKFIYSLEHVINTT